MFFKLKERRRKIFVEKYIDKMKSLERILEQYKVSESTGVSLSDYVALYETIRLIKPKFVLECGTGKSTWIISQAMLDRDIPLLHTCICNLSEVVGTNWRSMPAATTKNCK